MSTIQEAQELLDQADAILISASNGLSISEGFNIFTDDDNFKKYFGDFREQFGITSILMGVQVHLPDEARKKFNQLLRQYMIEDYKGSPQFQQLLQIIGKRDYFVVTSNADHHFQINDFDDSKIWEIEGDFFDRRMRDAHWDKQQQAFQKFVESHANEQVVQIELGIGAANQLIKAPLMSMVAKNPKWSFLTINLPGQINIPEEIENQSLALTGDLAQIIKKLSGGEN